MNGPQRTAVSRKEVCKGSGNELWPLSDGGKTALKSVQP